MFVFIKFEFFVFINHCFYEFITILKVGFIRLVIFISWFKQFSFYEFLESILIPSWVNCRDLISILFIIEYFKKVLKFLCGAPSLKVVNYTYMIYLIVVLVFQLTGDRKLLLQGLVIRSIEIFGLFIGYPRWHWWFKISSST